jgi:hypothetical protein
MSNYTKFRGYLEDNLESAKLDNQDDAYESTEQYVVGFDQTGNYVSKHRDTGKLLNSTDIHLERPGSENYEGLDYYETTSGDDSAFFESYKGQFVNGKREGMGEYEALDIGEGESSLKFTGLFENNLPVKGTLKFMENGQFYTTIMGVFVNGLPDETKECDVVYSVYQNGKKKEETKMKGFISFRNESGVFPRDLESKLSPNTPNNLLDVYLGFGFKVTGTKQFYPPPSEFGVFSSHGEKLASLGGMRSKKRTNYKRKQSLKK